MTRRKESGWLFRCDDFKNIDNVVDRAEFLKQKAKDITDFFTDRSGSKTPSAALESLSDFATVLADSYVFLVPESMNLLLQSVKIFHSRLGSVPQAGSYLPIFDIALQTLTDSSDNEVVDLFYDALEILFSESSFCSAFVEAKKVSATYGFVVNRGPFERVSKLITLFESSMLIDMFAENGSSGEVIEVFERIVGAGCESTMKFSLFVLHARFVSKIIATQAMFALDLVASGVLTQVNDILITCSPPDQMKFYSALLSGSDYDVIIPFLEALRDLYQRPMASSNNKLPIIEFLCGKDALLSRWVNSSSCALEEWFEPEITRSETLLSTFFALLSKCAHYNPLSIKGIISRVIELVVPPCKEGMLYEELFWWLVQVSKVASGNVKVFDDRLFISSIENASVADWKVFIEKFEPLRKLFAIILSRDRGCEFSDQLLTKITLLMGEFQATGSFQEFFFQLFQKMLCPNLLQFIFNNLENSSLKLIMVFFANEYSSTIIEMFKTCDLFPIIERKIQESTDAAMFILKVINLLVLWTNDHFFDDWVLEQPKDSPLFQLDGEEIKTFVFPPSRVEPILIPSLAPQCEPFSSRCPYNRYLIGRYAIPCYRKLGVPLQEIPSDYVMYSLNQFIRFEDFVSFIEDDPSQLIKHLHRSPISSHIFEVCPQDVMAWITIDTAFTFLSFKAIFYSKSDSFTPFLVFNKFSLSVQRLKLTDPSQAPIADVLLDKWYKITIFMNRQTGILIISLDQNVVYRTELSEDLVFESIGSPTIPPQIHYAVGTAAVISNSVDLDELLRRKLDDEAGTTFHAHGFSVSVPHHSYSDIMNEPLLRRVVFDRLIRHGAMKELVSVVGMEMSHSSRDAARLLSELCFTMTTNSKQCTEEVCHNTVAIILAMRDDDMRNRLLCSFLSDFGLISSLTPELVKVCLETINGCLETSDEILNANFLCDKMVLYYCVIYMIQFKDTPACEPLATLIYGIANRADVTKLNNLVDLLDIAGVWNMRVGIDFHQEKMEELLMTYDRTSAPQDHLLAILCTLERKRRIKLLSDEQRIFFALVSRLDMAMSILISLVELCASDEFVDTHMAILTKAFRRFPASEWLWRTLFVHLTGNDKFDFNSPIDETKPIRWTMVNLVLQLLPSLFNSELSDIGERVCQAIKDILIPRFKTASPKKIESSLFCLLRKGDVPWSLQRPEIPAEIAQFPESEFKVFYSNFVKDCKQKYGDSRTINDGYTNFIVGLVVGLLQQSMNTLKHFTALVLILKVSDHDILTGVLTRFLEQVRETQISTPVLSAISNICTFVILRYAGIINDDAFAENVFQFCMFDKSRYPSFMDFYLLSLQSVSKNIQLRTMELLRLYVTDLHIKTIDDFAVYLYVLVQNDVSSCNSFANELWSRMKALENVPDAMHELMKFDTFEEFLEQGETEITHFQGLFFGYFSKKVEALTEKYEVSYSSSEKAGRVTSFLLKIACRRCYLAFEAMRKLVKDFNSYLRYQETTYARLLCNETIAASQSKNSADLQSAKTHRLLSFHAPICAPLSFMPSSFGLDCVQDLAMRAVHLGISLFETENASYFDMPQSPSRSVDALYYMAGAFHTDSILKALKRSIGDDGSFVNATLISKSISIDCVSITQAERILILTGATFADGEIILTNIENTFFLQTVLENGYGEYQLFYGHPVLFVPYHSILMSMRIRESLAINSCVTGSLILKFQDVVPRIHHKTKLDSLKTEAIQNWQSGAISNMELLITLNGIAGRYFDDLSAYPIFPRVLNSFNSDHFLNDFTNTRDLGTPLLVLCDRDPEHNMLMMRMESQGYHHCENVSNSVHVSLFLLRVIPFFNYQYKFHGGYDQVERMFTSIPRQFCLSPEAVCEFSPEPFCCEEMFENENNITLPDGKFLELELPKWAPTPLYFVELHRAALESPVVRGQINKWIDLMFGYKLSGQAAIDSMNLYNPMGYHDPHPTSQNNEMRDQWISSCGQMPDQLFDEPCPGYSTITTLDSTSITFDMNPIEIQSKFKLHTDSCLLAADKAKLYDERFSTALHFCVSARERFCAVTSSASLVIVVHVKTTDSKVSLFKHQALFARSNPRFSVLNDRQMTCMTVCQTEIVVWSIVNGMVLNVIEKPSVSHLVSDDEMNTFYFVSGTRFYKYTLNGKPVAELDLGQDITSLVLVPIGFSFDKRILVVGTKRGTVLQIGCDFTTHCLAIIGESHVSAFPIHSLNVRHRRDILHEAPVVEVRTTDTLFVAKA